MPSGNHGKICVALLVILQAIATHPHAEERPIDVGASSVTVHVFKSGLFSAFADNHVVNAPIASGRISDDSPAAISFSIRTGDLRVLDPGLAPAHRAEVQARMLSADVLDASTFPEITFASTKILPTGPDKWQVTGQLTLHGHVQTIAFAVARASGKYRGQVALKQHDFGIEPIKIAGGTVRVKDEVTIQFEIAA